MTDKANRPECRKCEMNLKGRCRALSDTRGEGECSFLATPERLAEDERILNKAIAEGRVKPE